MNKKEISCHLVHEAYRSVKCQFKDTMKKCSIGDGLSERLNNRRNYGPDNYQSFEEYFESNKIEENQFHKVEDERLKCLRKLLHSIPMSAQKAYEHMMTYTVDDADTDNEYDNYIKIFNQDELSIINKNRDQLSGIMHFWLNRARVIAGQKRNIPDDIKFPNNNSELTRYILRGKPGVGKTALLNYMFSINAHCFKDFKVIWSQVDLSNPKGVSLDLHTLLFSKFLTIFCARHLHKDKFRSCVQR